MTHYKNMSAIEYFVSILVIFLMVTPIFVTTGGLFNSSEYGERGFPISLAIAGLLFLLFVRRHRPLNFSILAYLIIILSIPFIIFNISDNRYFTLTLISIYTLPLLIGYVASLVCLNLTKNLGFEKLVVFACVPVSVISVFWLTYQIPNILEFGRANGSVWDIFTIYQVWVYWPTVLAIFFCLQLGQKGHLATFNLIITGFAILASGAREPIALCLVFNVLLYLSKRDFDRLKLLIFWGGAIGIAISIALIYFPDTVISEKIMRQVSGDQGISAGRFEIAATFDWFKVSPFIGTGFSEYGIFESPHNQYLELYYRGGLVALVVVYCLVKYTIFAEGRSHNVKIILITIFIVSFNINVPLRSPYAAVIIWFLFFSNLKAPHRKHSSETNSSKSLNGPIRAGRSPRSASAVW